MTLQLPQALQAWGTADFESQLKRELLQQLDQLPLQQGLQQGNRVLDAAPTVLLKRGDEAATEISILLGILYQSVIGGCSCADDPTPLSELNEYCEVRIVIARADGAATVTLQD